MDEEFCEQKFSKFKYVVPQNPWGNTNTANIHEKVQINNDYLGELWRCLNVKQFDICHESHAFKTSAKILEEDPNFVLFEIVDGGRDTNGLEWYGEDTESDDEAILTQKEAILKKTKNSATKPAAKKKRKKKTASKKKLPLKPISTQAAYVISSDSDDDDDDDDDDDIVLQTKTEYVPSSDDDSESTMTQKKRQEMEKKKTKNKKTKTKKKVSFASTKNSDTDMTDTVKWIVIGAKYHQKNQIHSETNHLCQQLK